MIQLQYSVTLLSFAFRRSDRKCCAKAVSVEYRHIPFILSHVSWISFFIYILLCSWLYLCLVFPLFSEPLVKLAGERSPRPTPKRFPPLGRLANGIEKNANESTIHNNNTAERTKYDQTTIVTRFTRKSNSTEEDVTRFSSPYLCSRVVLNSGHPVRKSKFGACTVTGYCSFNNPLHWSLTRLISDSCLRKGQLLCFSVEDYFSFVTEGFARKWLSDKLSL